MYPVFNYLAEGLLTGLLQAGIDGIICSTASPSELLSTIHSVPAGNFCYLGETVKRRAADRQPKEPRITPSLFPS